jgi:hypothetical protein
MAKKILAICAALVAFVALPAVASAAPELQDSSGTKVAVGSSLTATNNGNIVFTGSNGVNVTCSESSMGGEVKTNSGTLIEGTIKSASFTGAGGGACASNGLGAVTVTIPGLVSGTSHWCIKTTKTADAFELIGANCGTASGTLTFVLHTEFGACSYKRTSSVTGTFTTNTVPAVLTLGGEPEFTKEEGSFLCPSSGKLDAKYNLTGYKIV